MARASAPQLAHSQGGVSSRGPSRSSRAAPPRSATRRSTAFTSPSNGARPRSRASATAVATAAWGGGVEQQQPGRAQPQHLGAPGRAARGAGTARSRRPATRPGAARPPPGGAPPRDRVIGPAATCPVPSSSERVDGPAPRSADRTRRPWSGRRGRRRGPSRVVCRLVVIRLVRESPGRASPGRGCFRGAGMGAPFMARIGGAC